MKSRALGAVAALAAALTCFAPPAGASPPRPADLRVVGGDDAWHAENHFALTWTNPSTEGGPPLAAVRYRIRNPQGTAIDETQIDRRSDGVSSVIVPKVPGTYSFEVWFEDPAGDQGPAATARLRFDDIRPAAIEPPSVPSWIGRTAFPLRVRLARPPGPFPVSGIRGYAVAIDTTPGASPCAKTDRCTNAETALRGGVEDDTLTIAALPEGTSYLHAVAVSGSGMKPATSGHAVLRVDTTDPITHLAGSPAGWTNQTAALSAHATDAGSGMGLAGDGSPPFTAIQVDGGAPTIALGGSATASVIGEGVHRVAYYARDAAGNLDDGGAGNGTANRPPRTAWVRIDRSPPNLAFTNSQSPRDPDLIRVRIADSLSGADPSRGSVGVRKAGSGDRFQPLPPAPAGSGELRARWDSDAYPGGEYEFRATGYDAAGNSAVTTRRANGTPMVLANPLKAASALDAGFGGPLLTWHRCARHDGQRRCRRETTSGFAARPATRTVPYGRGIRFSGRLTTGWDTPLSGMPVRIVERFAAGAGPEGRVSEVRTDPNGAFSIRLVPGPSRAITANFDGGATLTRSTSSPLELLVRSSVRLQTSAAVARIGGAPLVFRGRVLAPPGAIPAEGKSVQLQFRLPGLPWTEFRTVQTDRHGRFRYAYRFSDDDSRGARFQFRAYAPAQEDWPYEPGGSRPILVQGR